MCKERTKGRKKAVNVVRINGCAVECAENTQMVVIPVYDWFIPLD